MEPISESEFQDRAKSVFESVFVTEDPYRAPFRPNIQPRLLLYWFRYGLIDTEPWLKAVTKAIKAIGEDGFYLTLLRRVGDEPWHWYVPLEEAGLYIEKAYPVENAIYSVNGNWGIICSEEDHAVAGGPKIFIDTIYETIPDWDYRLKVFVDNWKGYHEQNKEINIDWLPVLLAHVYGSRKAKQMLEDAKLLWLISKLESKDVNFDPKEDIT